MSFWGELRRRNVVRVGVAYLAVAWLLIQVADTVLPNFNAPVWAMQALILASAIGFPCALVLAWFYEFTATGIKPERETSRLEGQRFASRKIDFAIIGVLVLAVGFLLVQPDSGQGVSVMADSIAVLPLDDLSPNPDDAFYAPGIHAELITQLQKLQNLTVISRESVLHYSETRPRLADIAADLRVESLLTGSLQFLDGQIRLSVSLVDPQTESIIWGQDYQEEFADILQVQADIAMNVANRLTVAFSIEERNDIEARPTDSTEAYALYLESRSLMDTQNAQTIVLALDLIDEALELDSDFALAWAQKAWLHFNAMFALPNEFAEQLEFAESAAQQAIDIDPTLAPAYAALADVLATQGDFVGAQRALSGSGSSGNPFIPVAGGHFDRISQRFSEGINRNPRHANFYVGLMLVNEALGNDEEVLRTYELGRRLFPSWEGGDFSMLRFLRGRRDHEEIRAMLSDRSSAFHPLNFEILPVLDDPQAARLKLYEMFEDPSLNNPLRRIDIAAWAAYFNDTQLALQAMEESVSSFRLQLAGFWVPLFDDLRQTESFRNYLREWGVVDYWNEFGWPPQCTEIGGNEFRCE